MCSASRLSIGGEQAEEIKNFIKSRVNHSYNGDTFDRQLNQEIGNNLMKLEAETIKSLKHKLYREELRKLQIQKQEKVRKTIQTKISNSKRNRDAQMELKLAARRSEKDQRYDLFVQRLSQVRQEDLSKSQMRKERLSLKGETSRVQYNKANRAVSLIAQSPSQRQNRLTEQHIMRLKDMVRAKQKIQRYYSRDRSFSESNQLANGSDLTGPKHKIPRQRSLQQTVFRGGSLRPIDNQKANQEQSDRSILPKLVPRSYSLNSIKSNRQKSQFEWIKKGIEKPKPNSIIYEQSEEREKYSYRKDIKDQIREYMIRQKTKYLQE